MGIYYLGAFPPAYGGVTIKNRNLYQALSKEIEIEKIDFTQMKRKKITEIVHFLQVICNRKNRFVIGISGQYTRKRFTRLLYYFNRKAMNNSVIFLMGGTAAGDIVSDRNYLKYAAEYKKIYAETYGMIKTLEGAGLTNAGYYPNGRFKSKKMPVIKSSNDKLQCVFFSKICQDKGADIVLEVAKKIPEITFTFYGMIEEKYKSEFNNKMILLSNVKYNGIFEGEPEAVYKELAQYDILLLPTKWKAEGVPGIFVEAKIAGLAIIASDQNFNSELVNDGKDGFILKDNYGDNLRDILKKIEKNKGLLYKLRQNSLRSADKYYIENYLDGIINEILN